MLPVSQIITDAKQIIARETIDDTDLDFTRLVHLACQEMADTIPLHHLETSIPVTIAAAATTFDLPLDLQRPKQ